MKNALYALLIVFGLVALYVFGILRSQNNYWKRVQEAEKILASISKFENDFGYYPEDLSALKNSYPTEIAFDLSGTINGKPIWIYKKWNSGKEDPFLFGFRTTSQFPGLTSSFYWMHSKKRWTSSS